MDGIGNVLPPVYVARVLNSVPTARRSRQVGVEIRDRGVIQRGRHRCRIPPRCATIVLVVNMAGIIQGDIEGDVIRQTGVGSPVGSLDCL